MCRMDVTANVYRYCSLQHVKTFTGMERCQSLHGDRMGWKEKLTGGYGSKNSACTQHSNIIYKLDININSTIKTVKWFMTFTWIPILLWLLIWVRLLQCVKALTTKTAVANWLKITQKPRVDFRNKMHKRKETVALPKHALTINK